MRLTWAEVLSISLAVEDRKNILRRKNAGHTPFAEPYADLERRLDDFLQNAPSIDAVLDLEWKEE